MSLNVAPIPDAPAAGNSGGELLLSAHELRKTYGGRAVVDGVCLQVRPGEIVGLLGPNGAGKTTSFYIIAGIVPPEKGKVRFAGRDISRLPMHRRARLGLGYLPQEESVFRKLTVEENLLAVLETRRNLGRKARRQRAHELLERFGIDRVSKSHAILPASTLYVRYSIPLPHIKTTVFL